MIDVRAVVAQQNIEKRECMCVPSVKLGEHDIDIWLAFYEGIGEGSLAEILPLLDADERKRQVRFLLEDDRKRYLVTRGMVRTVLSEYAEVAPEEWRFQKGRFGRPGISDGHGVDACALSFNISHTRGLIAIAITLKRAVGVDVEHVALRRISLEAARSSFTPEEMAELMRLPAHLRQERFFEYWTFKEAYAKARGLGMAIPLERFGFDLAMERSVRLVADPGLDHDPHRWRFWQCRPAQHHLLALCADVDRAVIPRILTREWRPFSLSEEVNLEFFRTS
ncbi:4'-phosphopantetheinyl transferase family protein [uncultured Xanthomonas sp.]|uniref:4'-phosphopantetheinyl transferase family protein n=1 Tax=uncultured Xanthomonas sp. TaxID=152831 RepID=UPI0037485F48